jgi:hypothetical protein
MRKTYSILSIALRHPILFAMMMKINRINTTVIYADSQNEMNRVF